MIVLICGGRFFTDWELLCTRMDMLHHQHGPFTRVVHGKCPLGGADILGGQWGEVNGIPVDEYPIEPGEGGFRRNGRMLKASGPDLVVGFPGGNGTLDMVRRALEAGVQVARVRANGRIDWMGPVHD